MKILRDPRYLAGLGAILLIGIATLAFALLGNRDDGSEPGAVASVTLEPSVPAATPTQQAGANPFADFKLEVVTGEIELAKGTSQIPADRVGVWFLDVQTSEVEGWSDQIGGIVEAYAFSGDNRITAFRRREQVFQGGVVYPAGFRLADRTSGIVYRWQGAAEPVLAEGTFNGSRLAAEDGRVLLRVAAQNGENWFAVIDLDPQGKVEAMFQAGGPWGLLSEDGSKAAVFGSGHLSLVDLRTGEVQPVKDEPQGPIESQSKVSLQNNLGGGGLLATISPLNEGYVAAWSQHTWDGRLLAGGSGTFEIYPAPSGNVLAMVEPWGFRVRTLDRHQTK